MSRNTITLPSALRRPAPRRLAPYEAYELAQKVVSDSASAWRSEIESLAQWVLELDADAISALADERQAHAATSHRLAMMTDAAQSATRDASRAIARERAIDAQLQAALAKIKRLENEAAGPRVSPWVSMGDEDETRVVDVPLAGGV